MFPPVETAIVAKGALAGFAVAVLWFGLLDRWWKGSDTLALATLLPLRLVVAAAGSAVTSYFLYQFLLEVVGAEDPRAGIFVGGLLWGGFLLPVILLGGVSGAHSIRRIATDLCGAFLFIVVIGGTLGLFAGPYR